MKLWACSSRASWDVAHPVLVEDVALKLIIPSAVQLLLAHQRANLNMLHPRDFSDHRLCCRALAGAGRAGHQDVGPRSAGGRHGCVRGKASTSLARFTVNARSLWRLLCLPSLTHALPALHIRGRRDPSVH